MMVTPVMTSERRESKQSVMVVLDGVKVSAGERGVAPLVRAVRYVANPDEILVLILLHGKAAETSSSVGSDKVHRCNAACLDDPNIKFLQQEISQRKEIYMQILRPFYHGCKNNGLKFQVMIAAGFQIKDIIVEEASHVKATWIVMDSCFAGDLVSGLSGTHCKISLVSDDDEAIVQDYLPAHDGLESTSIFRNINWSQKSQKQMKGSISAEEPHVSSYLPEVAIEDHPLSPAIPEAARNEGEEPDMNRTYEDVGSSREVQLLTEGTLSPKAAVFPSNAGIMLGLPVQLNREVILEIARGFKKRIPISQDSGYSAYHGFLEHHRSLVLIKKYRGESGCILEAEKKAASCLHHRNILRLIGYSCTKKDTILVFPFQIGVALDQYLFDLSRKQQRLSFQEKMKIALGTSQAVRYMHEECPRGPIAHGELYPRNVFLTSDLQPMITGFQRAKWLQLGPKAMRSNRRCVLEDFLDHGSMELLKFDVFCFGVLLLRLFCRNSVPQEDKVLIDWARPLLIQRAFHELLDEDADYLDIHAIYRVMTAASLCTRSKPISRPCMSEVISILKDENFCLLESSPSDISA